MMRLACAFVVIALVVCNVDAKRKRKFEGDFEFAEEDDTKGTLKSPNDRKKWVYDPDSELCQTLNCKKKEMCLLDDTMTAQCVNKKILHKNGDVIMPRAKVTEAPPLDDLDDDLDDDDDDVFYDSDDEEDADDVADTATKCKPCPIVQPTFICGADNRTYSSLCRLDYHNCLHRSTIKVSCKGFCPCKDVELHMKRQKQTERVNNFITKYKNTVERDNDVAVSKSRVEKPEKKNPKPSKMSKISAEKKKHLQDKYSFVPKEFKYDNQHYKYIKYKYNKPSYQEDKEVIHNEVLDPRPGHVNAMNKECTSVQLQAMGNRLLDWFSVVMADSNRRRQRTIIKGDYPLWCKSEVRWMFAHLDLDGDNLLTEPEMARIERDGQEKCMKPWVDRCDVDRDGSISHKEWCRCFDKTDRPCLAAKRNQAPFLLGAYVPECDSQGFYHATQCHKSVGMCWCVDKHGVELANTRSRNRPNCEAALDKQKNMTSDDRKPAENETSDDDDDDDEEEDDDMEGSGDQPLDF